MSENQAPPPAPKVPSQSLLGGARPRPTRYKRNLILALTGGAAVLFTGALVYGLFHSPGGGGTAQQQQPANTGNLPQFGNFPSNYAQVTAKPPAPPAPKAPLAPTNATAPAQPTPLQPVNQTNGNTQPTPAEVAAEKAMQSNIFFQGTTDPGLQSERGTTGTPSIIPVAGAGAAPGGALAGGAGSQPVPPGADQSLQGEKNNFITANAQQPSDDYTGKPLQSPISPYEVQAGSIIPAALITAVDSDLPGDVIAQVTEDVYDSPTGHYLLIPQGAKLYGRYDSLISYGQTRALIVWNRIIFPNGKSVDLGGMIGTDPTGASGIKDKVNRHLWGLTAALGAATLLSFGPSLALEIPQSGGSNNTNIYTNPATTLGENVNNIGQEFVSKELNRPNTITIRAGWPLRVLVNKDMILAPYTP